ncbi:hypothetical protein PY310_14705 [Pseudarthrobacter sp. H3Y2-7]|uniref:hypothetical protein n=1 Tax=Pseudarthrobacter naphthalenicus TaxID=3031328 RepID=UPI0023B12907|nr:hypothetical protein [Pseudarthrobacter sp. H3Y2-7]MDE8669830.1 hypothetical protein [Pseudarthrobacter sp. H3Y2-7]
MEELAWFEDVDAGILSTIVMDRTDGDYGGIILARDMNERYRFIDQTDFFETPERAVLALNLRLLQILPDLEALRVQGDETGQPIDFFAPLSTEEKLHPNFLHLTSDEGFSAARRIIGAMMRWNRDVDGNFVEQFQTTGFDPRLWELYLSAALTEAGLFVDRPDPAPDFTAIGPLGGFAMEATTINPSIGTDGKPIGSQKPSSEAEIEHYVQHYLPTRYAGALTAKLHKEYWKRPVVAGKPLVFAIQDFHDAMSMTYSGTALATYLYGYRHEAKEAADGSLVILPIQVVEHRWGEKTVPSGFFSLPGAENISAVIFNSSATLSKFNRMGVGAGFGSNDVVLIRRGFYADRNPDSPSPRPYIEFVTDENSETWIEGMDVYHNPRATHVLEPRLLPGAAHHRLLEDGRIETMAPHWKPLQSQTSIVILTGNDQPGAESAHTPE